MSNLSVEEKRVEALKNVSIYMRLIDERYIEDISKSLENKNEDLWMKTTEKAGVSKDKAAEIWKLANGSVATPGIVWFAPERKKPHIEERKKPR